MRQRPNVSVLPVEDRLSFYEGILVNCDLDTSRALVFIEVVGDDTTIMPKYLTERAASSSCGAFSKRQQQKILTWIDKFNDINISKGAEVQQSNHGSP